MPSIEYDRAGWTPDLAMEAYQKHQESVGSIHPSYDEIEIATEAQREIYKRDCNLYKYLVVEGLI